MLEWIISVLAIFIIGVINLWGLFGIVVLMAIESACIPLPSEIIMPFAGYLVYQGQYSLWAVAVAGALGCNLGSQLAYEVGKRGGRTAIQKWGKWVLLSQRDLDMADRFFARWGSATVFIARLLPVVRTFIALPAGIARMKLWPFHIYTFVGSFIWCYGLAWLGMWLGDAWNTDSRVKYYFLRFDFAIVGILLALGVWYLWSHWKHRVK
ncbi:MAG: DedA family protein [Candidatus Pacebacteria bacterium]|nr:DedA family protein [Candidatus Paceibacterota bacterium]